MLSKIVTINDLIREKISPDLISDEMINKMSYAIQNFEFWGKTTQEDLDYWRGTEKILLSRLKALKAAR